MQPKRQKAPLDGLIKNYHLALLAAAPRLSQEHMEAFVGATQRKRDQGMKIAVLAVLGKKSFRDATPDPVVEGWVSFYQRYFPDEFALAGGADTICAVQIPEAKGDLDRVLIVLSGLTPNRVYDECAKHFPCWRYTDDLDASVSKNDRTAANGTYAVRLRPRIEADEEYKNLSAKDVASRSIAGITLLERMILELRQYSEYQNHLDIENITLCTGSRRADGGVPRAYWGGGGFCVDWYDLGRRSPRLRVREVLS